jgi:hypothetical protein
MEHPLNSWKNLKNTINPRGEIQVKPIPLGNLLKILAIQFWAEYKSRQEH